MKLTVLCENSMAFKWGKYCLSEWWLSLLIEVWNIKILFDTWRSWIFWNNAEHLNINLNDVDFVVLSHHHWDHAWWLNYHKFKSKKKLIVQSELLSKLTIHEKEKFKNDFDIIEKSWAYEFYTNIFFLWEIPRKNNFEKWEHKWDNMNDDTALAIKSNKWVIIISWCSHSWICNICEYAKEITWQNIYAIIWWFHLYKEDSELANKTIEYLKKENPSIVLPMHCVDFENLVKMSNELNAVKIATWDDFEIN